MFTSDKYADIIYTDETMREGMQIEAADIPVKDKIALLDALSETGLKRIMVGSFVSAKYTPQMRHIEEIVTGFKPKPGVTYMALTLNQRGNERAAEFSPPLTLQRNSGRPRLYCHMCDIFVRRNTNKGQADEMASWTATVAAAKAKGVKEATIAINAAFGSNFIGDIPVDVSMKMLELQHSLWDEAGITVKQLILSDPMGWCHPAKVTDFFLWTEGQMCRLMTMRSISIDQSGKPFVYEGSAEKITGPEHGVRATETVSQILGPHAQLLSSSRHTIENGVFAHNLLGAFQSTVNHGSVQVMRDQVARKALDMPRTGIKTARKAAKREDNAL